jgi:hypothetical protein
MEFFQCDDDSMNSRLLGIPYYEDVRNLYPEHTSLLHLEENEEIGLRFYDCGTLDIVMKESDLKYGNWKKVKAYLHSL